MSARQLPAIDYLGLKAAFRQLVRRMGGSTHAAGLTRVRQQEISNYGSPAPDYAERFAPVDVIADLEAEVGPVVTAELARLSNHALVRLPEIPGGLGALGRITAQALKEVSDVFSLLGAQLGDGVLSAVEGAQLEKEIDEAIAKLLALKLQATEIARRQSA